MHKANPMSTMFTDNNSLPTPLTPESQAIKLDSHALFEGRKEIIIIHQDQEYRLRITRQDKLILTK